MAKSTTYPHQDLIAKNAIDVTTLSAKTQSLITKFAAETDEEKKEAMDEKIYGEIEDHFVKLKAMEEKEKTTAGTKTTTAATTKKVDVSTAGTTKTPEQEAAEKATAAAAAPKTGLMNRIYNRK